MARIIRQTRYSCNNQWANIILQNDDFEATNLDTAQSYTEDTPLNLTDIVVSRVGAGLDDVTVTLTLSNTSAGSLNTGTSGAVTSTYVGGVWTASGAIANVNTLLAALVFTPTANFNSSFTIAVEVTHGDDVLTGTKSITGVAANDAPVLDATKSPVFNSVAQNAGAPSGTVGTLVSFLVDLTPPSGALDNVSDVESNIPGIAVVAADTTSGTWFYSINGGTTWSALGAVTASSSRLLAPTARLYFQPNNGFSGTIANGITFRAWDQTSGTNGSLVNTSTNGGTTAFSSATDTASIQVVAP